MQASVSATPSRTHLAAAASFISPSDLATAPAFSVLTACDSGVWVAFSIAAAPLRLDFGALARTLRWKCTVQR